MVTFLKPFYTEIKIAEKLKTRLNDFVGAAVVLIDFCRTKKNDSDLMKVLKKTSKKDLKQRFRALIRNDHWISNLLNPFQRYELDFYAETILPRHDCIVSMRKKIRDLVIKILRTWTILQNKLRIFRINWIFPSFFFDSKLRGYQ